LLRLPHRAVLPPCQTVRPEVHYNPRERYHNKALIPKTFDLNDGDFLIRNVYKRIY